MARVKRKRIQETVTNGPDQQAKPSKRIRKFDDEAAQLAVLYNELASEVKRKRLQAAENLVQLYHEKLDTTTGDSFDNLSRPLTRLTRGLCSNRKAARMGFYAALSEILHLFAAGRGYLETDLTRKYLDLIEKTTKVESQASKQEKRDHMLGYILANEALLQEGLLLGCNIPELLLRDVIERICRTAHQNTWLREECGLALYKALNRVNHQEHGPRIARLILETQRKYSMIKTPEGIATWLQAMEMGSKIPNANQDWHHGYPLSREELKRVALIFKQGHAITDGSKDPSIEKWTHLNFAWDVIFKHMLLQADPDQNMFNKFWKLSVDDTYFNATASAEMKYRGFQILDHIIKIAPTWALQEIFSSQIVNRIINQSGNADRYLHDAALSVLKSIVARGERDPQAGLCIAGKLLSPPSGVVDFDKRTGTKTVQKLCSSIKPSEFERHLLPSLLHAALPQEPNTETSNYFYQCVADLYLNITRGLVSMLPEAPSEIIDEVISALKSFALHGFIDYQIWNTGSKMDLPVSCHAIFRARFFSLLLQVLSSTNQTVTEHVLQIPELIRSYGSESIIPLVAAESVILDSLAKSEITYQELLIAASSKHKSNPSSKAMALFYSITLLRAYDGEEDALSMLADLRETAQDMIREEGSQKLQRAMKSIIDLILSSLSTPSALSRKVADRVFATLSPNITADGLNLLVESLLDKTPLMPMEETINSDADDLSDGYDSAASSSTLSSSSNDSNLGNETFDVAEDDQASSSEISDSDGSEEARFNALLAEALNTSKAKSDGELIDASASSEEESMDDEQMMELEPHLSAIFRERRDMLGGSQEKRSKTEKKKNNEQNTNFKNRILDLLLIYVKQQHNSDLGLTLVILPVLKFLGTTTNKQSAGKASELLRQYFDTARTKGMPKSNDQHLVLRIMDDVHAEALGYASKQHAAACSRASLFLAKVLIGENWGDHALVMKRYADTAHAAYEQGSKLPSSFLTDGMNWSRSLKS